MELSSMGLCAAAAARRNVTWPKLIKQNLKEGDESRRERGENSNDQCCKDFSGEILKF